MDCPVTCKEAALNDVSVKFADLGVRFPTFALSLLKSDCVCPPLFLLVDMMGDLLVGSFVTCLLFFFSYSNENDGFFVFVVFTFLAPLYDGQTKRTEEKKEKKSETPTNGIINRWVLLGWRRTPRHVEIFFFFGNEKGSLNLKQ